MKSYHVSPFIEIYRISKLKVPITFSSSPNFLYSKIMYDNYYSTNLLRHIFLPDLADDPRYHGSGAPAVHRGEPAVLHRHVLHPANLFLSNFKIQQIPLKKPRNPTADTDFQIGTQCFSLSLSRVLFTAPHSRRGRRGPSTAPCISHLCALCARSGVATAFAGVALSLFLSIAKERKSGTPSSS